MQRPEIGYKNLMQDDKRLVRERWQYWMPGGRVMAVAGKARGRALGTRGRMERWGKGVVGK